MNCILSYPLFEKGIEFDENQVLQVTVENKKAFFKMINDVFSQVNGCETNFLLSNDFKEINLHKKSELIIDYLTVSENEKSILQKLYSDLASLTEDSNYISQKNELYSLLCSYIESLSDELDISIEYSAMDFKTLLKALDIKVENKCTDSLGDKLINYVKMNTKLLGKDVFMFVNLKSFLSEEELKELYKYMIYNKLIVIDFESKEYSKLEIEKTIIIDNDLCQIS